MSPYPYRKSRRVEYEDDEDDEEKFAKLIGLAVSIRLIGDLASAQRLLPVAKQVMARAMALQNAGQPLVKLFHSGTDGSLVYAFLHGPVKHLYVQPGPVRAPEVPVEEISKEILEELVVPEMYNGVVTPGDAVQVLEQDGTLSDPPRYALRRFHPTAICADVYQLEFEWQDVEKLGTKADQSISSVASTWRPMQAAWPKPSMYSGPMKRIVQAIYGIAKTQDAPDGEDLTIEAINHYNYRWECTHGIRKAGVTHWLVEVSKERGVLAMPLPLFAGSVGEAFLSGLESIGDTETMSVVSEFGGLPTGEAFPIDDPLADPPSFALTEALEEGSVLRLCTADQLKPFYYDDVNNVDKEAWSPAWGWAFSQSGENNDVYNTCRWYRRPDIALGDPRDNIDGEPKENRYLSTELWKLTIALPDLTEPESTRVIPSATLTLVESSVMVNDVSPLSWGVPVDAYSLIHPLLRVPLSDSEEYVAPVYWWGKYPHINGAIDTAQFKAELDISAPVFVCFNGEEIEVVRHAPPKTYTDGFMRLVGYDYLSEIPAPSWEALPGAPRSATGYYTGVVLYLDDVTEEMVPNGWIYSPTGAVWLNAYEYSDIRPILRKRSGCFYSTSIDLREDEEWGSISTEDPVQHYKSPNNDGRRVRLLRYADYWEADIGVCFPQGCREGYVMTRFHRRVSYGTSTAPLFLFEMPGESGVVDPISGAPPREEDYGGIFGDRTSADFGSIQTKMFYSGHGVADGPTIENAYVPAVYPSPVDGDEWTLKWKHLGYGRVDCSASINAGPRKMYAMTAGVCPQFGSHVASYIYVMPDTISVGSAVPTDVTFVGAV